MTTATSRHRGRAVLLTGLMVTFGLCSFQIIKLIAGSQPLGVDFGPLWAGARVALNDPQRLYDFDFVSRLQGPWAVGHLRPFVYPPSSLPFFVPLAMLPMGAAYWLWTTATAAIFTELVRRAGAGLWPWVFPVVCLVAILGQVTFALSALVIGALMLRNRPLLAGVLLGCAAALKPQALIFLPVGLVATGAWRTLWSWAATTSLVCAASTAIWGPHIWLDWLQAVHRFEAFLRADPRWLNGQVSASAALQIAGLPPSLALLLVPGVAWLVWVTFRTTEDPLNRAAAALGGALFLSSYAMLYDAALLAPAVAAAMRRTDDRLWLLYAVLGFGFVFSVAFPIGLTITGLAVPLAAWWSARSRQLGPPPTVLHRDQGSFA